MPPATFWIDSASTWAASARQMFSFWPYGAPTTMGRLRQRKHMETYVWRARALTTKI